MHPIAERIMDGEDICPGEIWQDNASVIIEQTAYWVDHAHDAKGCTNKDCHHGDGNDLPYAAELTERAARECWCGQHI